ncbi:aromatic-ring-hydroxylating dioxygenase subunit beta [Hyalangium rubrum]|uniref:Nuclear transport factor 2 family protein n=1 Tax=Hyalangium rubrum TaxID=3103134 RepID=A0ABU5H3R1_9BACT|nr:nuclear transport factor 2 family protein [Hyalangium sp. s54d21]MDY7227739.1 nuclear transport factor 2 family protein [Hyalangium sp. s54d21]
MYDDILEVRHAVESLLYRYATCLDDGPLEHWAQCFTEEGQYRLLPRENFLSAFPVALMHCTSRSQLEERLATLRRAHATVPYACRHLYTNVQVAPERAGRASLRANYTVYHAVDEGEVELLSVGRLEARIRMEPAPLFERMDVIYETCRPSGLKVYPL